VLRLQGEPLHHWHRPQGVWFRKKNIYKWDNKKYFFRRKKSGPIKIISVRLKNIKFGAITTQLDNNK
jgi:hypothetical protein